MQHGLNELSEVVAAICEPRFAAVMLDVVNRHLNVDHFSVTRLSGASAVQVFTNKTVSRGPGASMAAVAYIDRYCRLDPNLRLVREQHNCRAGLSFANRSRRKSSIVLIASLVMTARNRPPRLAAHRGERASVRSARSRPPSRVRPDGPRNPRTNGRSASLRSHWAKPSSVQPFATTFAPSRCPIRVCRHRRSRRPSPGRRSPSPSGAIPEPAHATRRRRIRCGYRGVRRGQYLSSHGDPQHPMRLLPTALIVLQSGGSSPPARFPCVPSARTAGALSSSPRLSPGTPKRPTIRGSTTPSPTTTPNRPWRSLAT